MEPRDGEREASGARSPQAREKSGEEKWSEERRDAHHEEGVTVAPRWLRYRALLVLLAVGACRTGRNYPDPAEPRYGGAAATLAEPVARGDTLRIVSFNIEYARETRRAIRILKSAPNLRNADVVLLQEMNGPAAKMVADSLGMHFVYYPAIFNRIMRRDIGNAVLSRWPIVEDAKLILPSQSRYAKTQRTATATTIQVGTRRVRVYSTHFGTPADLGQEGRVAQLKAILENAAGYALVVVGGDMNSKDIGRVAREAGYLWPTDTIPKSNLAGRLDHFFLRGVAIPDSAGAGTVRVPSTISDHSAIWIRLVLPH
jgi:endonuclease/exonuclease/phosphatase family metal-dependent hydrolase